jgi:hypothetical protein
LPSGWRQGISTIAAALTVQKRVLLFCLASGTEWAQAGVTGATATAMLVRGLVDRDASGRLALTPQGRARCWIALLSGQPDFAEPITNLTNFGLRLTIAASSYTNLALNLTKVSTWATRRHYSKAYQNGNCGVIASGD